MSKRKNGEGTYDKTRINGQEYFRWRGCLGIDPATGKVIRKSFYAKTEKELRQKVHDALKNAEAGVAPQPKTLTVAVWLRQWLKECCADLKPTTLYWYQKTCERQLIPALGGIRLADLQSVQIQAFINGIRPVCKRSCSKALSPKYIRNVYAVLHEALKQAVEWSMIARNPADGITLPRAEKHEVGFLAGEELKRFLAAVEGNPYADIFRVAVFTGMRESELLGLTWDCVDFQRQQITVRQQLQRIDKEYQVTTTKTSKVRTLTPSAYVIDILKRVRSDQNEIRLRMGSDWEDTRGFVFTHYNGRHIAKTTLCINFKKCLDKAGLPASYRFHDLRHSAAVFALESGDNIKEVSEMLGHSSTSFTADRYLHVSEQAKKASAARQQAAIEALFSQEKES